MSRRTSSPSRPRTLRWVRRAVIGILVIANIGVLGVWWSLRSAESAVIDNATTNHDVVAELTPAPASSSDPVTFLVIGSDTRAGLDDLTNFGDFAGSRADVIILVQVFPEEDRAQMLSIPRDLYVPISGHGNNRINAAYAFGGAPLMVDTVQAATGLAIHHYIEVDLAGFKAIVDELGGVELDFAHPARDTKSGLAVDAGRQVLDGDQALALARSRSYQEYRDGQWVAVDASDIGRTRRQQQLIFSILSQVARPSNLAEAGSLFGSFARHLTIDAALAERSLVEFAFSLRSLRSDDIEATTLPVKGTTIDGRSVVVPRQPEAEAVIAAFGDGSSLVAATQGPMRVEVLNGNGVKGSAGFWSQYLQEAGFVIARVGDAERDDFTETVVMVRPGDNRRGSDLVAALGFGSVTTGTLAAGLDALVVVGTDAGGASVGG